VRDDQLPQIVLNGSANQRVTFEDRDRLRDRRDRRLGVEPLLGGEVDEAIEIGVGVRRVDQRGQCLTLGLVARLPRARAAK
jgi:hypothetical protein